MEPAGSISRQQADSAINAGQIHADDAHAILTGEFGQVIFQGGLAAAQHDVVDGVLAQIAEGGGVAIFPGEEMLVNAQDAGTRGAAPLRQFTRQEMRSTVALPIFCRWANRLRLTPS